MTFWKRLGASIFLLISVLSLFACAKTEYTYGPDGEGVIRALPLERTPALYTGDFGDCLGGQSLFNITKFDAAYYADNLTIVFHLDGTSNIKNESLMMNIAVDAYGSGRYEDTFDPCYLNLYSLCPLNASVPITGWAKILVGPLQIGGIPPIAFNIPDFEGTARLRIFANSSETEIGCFQAAMKNGNSFSHPEAVAPILGLFTLVAIIASFATAAYGVSIVHMRMHYAHSLSVFVVFETFQSIFFTGALSVNWPSVCVAWWSNFAWSTGIIYTPGMVNSISSFAGVTGNASQVGGAGSVVLNTAGGLISQIYGRSLTEKASNLVRRAAYNASDPFDYTWAGNPVTPGMPLPGTWSGFPGTLAGLGVPAADAFLIGLIWVLIATGLVALSIVAFKGSLEGLVWKKWIKEDRLSYFRSHWTAYLAQALSRTFLISFFGVMTLAMYQFTIRTSTGMTAVTAITFALFLVGATWLITRACRARTRNGRFEIISDKIIFHHSMFLRALPIIIPAWSSTLKERELEVRPVIALSVLRIRHINDDPMRESVHQDQPYLKKFGWFSGKYRRTRWWFLAYYTPYLAVRAVFLAVGTLSPLTQIYGLLIIEIIAFAVIVILNPFEGTRNTALAVWMLSISKIASTGLSIAFLPAFHLDRIIATVLGVIIIVIQGFVVIAVMILTLLSAISTWMSLMRNREEFGADYLESIRVKYFEKMEARAPDAYKPPEDKKGKGKEEDGTPEHPREPYFSVVSVRRAPKIEDEDDDVVYDLEPSQNGINGVDPTALRGVTRASRTNSVSSRRSVNSLPRGIRAHRSSWSSKDFAQMDAAFDRPDSSLAQRIVGVDNTAGNAGDDSVPPVSATVRRQTSRQSLRSLSSVRPNSPFSPGLNTPSRETLAKHAEERRYPTPQPAIPDLE